MTSLRRTVPVISITVIWLLWYAFTAPNSWEMLQQNWQISVTMMIGSFIAGATSEGGGAIAFPVFTKLLHIAPQDAKVFSLAIQSVGMSMAWLYIIWQRISVEWRVIFWVSLGGFIGIILGSGFLSPLLPAAMTKMIFTSMIAAFAVTLWFSQYNKKHNYRQLPRCQRKEQVILMITGVLGGCISGLVGNGIDIMAFSVMVLLFRMCEKVATPTSVILMAVNAGFGFMLHLSIFGGFSLNVMNWWLAAVPIVVIGAPLGTWFCSRLSNVTIFRFLLLLIAVEIFSSMLLIELTPPVLYVSLFMFMTFVLGYYRLSRLTTYSSN